MAENALVRRVWQSHARRLAHLDPLLPPPVDPSAPASPLAKDTLFTIQRYGSEGVGSWQRRYVDPQSFDATFGPVHRHRLRVLLDGPDRAAATDALLDHWTHLLADEVGSPGPELDAGAVITWPARDVDGVASLVRRGFFCDHALAGVPVRALDRLSAPDPVDGVTLRTARLDDVDLVAALQLEQLIYDDRLGGTHLRPNTERAIRSRQVAALSRNDGSRIIAERDGRAIGLAAVSLAEDTSWLNDWVHPGPVGYVETLSVTERERSRGVGRLLADAAHRWARSAGADLVMLHYALVNPHSARFFATHGYRPLWIRWSAPLTRLLG